MITGCLQKKNGYYYAVLYLKVDGKRKPKWVPTKLPVEGTSERKAQKALDDIRLQYEKLEEARIQKEKMEAEQNKLYPPEARQLFSDYLENWLESMRPTLATTTYQSYDALIKARIRPHFDKLALTLGEVTPQHLQTFYQTILDDGCTTNTAIHYHAFMRKAIQSAVKKEILTKNPADQVDRPKRRPYHGSFYSEEEMMKLFDVIEGDPLEVCVKLTAYYGLRRSEVLGLKWDAIDFEKKTITIRHKVIEKNVNGKFIPVGEDVLKTKSSHRTLPLIPAIETLLLEEKEKQAMYRRLAKKSYCMDFEGYVCVNQLGNMFRPSYVSDHFALIIQNHGLRKIRFHDLRHSCASLLLSSGISMKQIQIWLGHSTFSTTADIYAHLDSSAQTQSALAIGNMFQRPSLNLEQ